MFYWSYKGIHIVLSDDEEMALVQELSKGHLERVGYLTSKEVRYTIEKRILRYLKRSLHADPEGFNRKYVFRSCYGKDAQKIFPVLLDGYGRITRRATIGSYVETSELQELAESARYTTRSNVFQITLFDKGRWLRKQPVVSGLISLPIASIEKVAGTADNFFVASATATIRFHRDFVRISILDMSCRPNDGLERDAKSRRESTEVSSESS